MATNLAENLPQILENQSEQDELNLAHFMEVSGIDSAQDNSLVNAVVWARLIKPIYGAEDSDRVATLRAINNIDKQNKTEDYRKFGPFTPRTLAHANEIRNENTEKNFDKALRVNLSAGESSYKQLAGRHTKAEREIKRLKDTVSETGDSPELNLGRLRQTQDVLYLLGDRLMRREFLDDHYWPAKNTKMFQDKQAYWRGAMLAAARYGSDELLETIINSEIQELQNEMIYWGAMKERIGRKLGGRAVKNSLTLKAGIRTGLLDEQLKAEAAAKAESEDDEADEPEIYSDKMPDHIRRSQIAKYASATQRIKNNTQQGASPEAAEKKEFAGGRAIWDKEDENIIGVELPDERVSASVIAKAQKPTTNAALNQGVRRLSGYDQQQDPSNPRPF